MQFIYLKNIIPRSSNFTFEIHSTNYSCLLEIFNFISLTLFIILGGLISIFTIYMLFTKIKLMYTEDFNAYRDFFLMYLAVGVILIIISSNPSLTMAFAFQFFPSLSVLIYAAILVVSVFLIFGLDTPVNSLMGL